MDELEAVGDPELRRALLFARSRPRPVTADELAAAESIHRNVARTRLERLVDAGLLAPGFERRTGRTGPGAGRPAKTYAVEPSLEPIEFPARRLEMLLALLVDAVPPGGRAKKLREVGDGFGLRLARSARVGSTASPGRALDAVCRALARLGYQATVEHVDEHSALIATPTCPVRPLVRAHADAAAIDRGMWAGMIRHALGGKATVHVECETAGCGGSGPCRISARF
jgi:predicted ArsR family transcriptional regulator